MISFLSRMTLPDSGVSSPAMIRKRVVFPDPLSPTIAVTRFDLTVIETSSSTVCVPKDLVILLRVRVGILS